MASPEQYNIGRGGRRAFVVTALGLTAAGAFRLWLDSGGATANHAPAIPTPKADQVALANAELRDIAEAGRGQAMVGNAVGNFPEVALRKLQAATFIATIRFNGPGLTATGVAVRPPKGSPNDKSVMLIVPAHEATDDGRRSPDSITGIEIIRPGDPGWTIVGREDLSIQVMPGYHFGDFRDDTCAIRIHPELAQRQLANVQPLEIAEQAMQRGEAVASGGYPIAMHTDDHNMRGTPLYVTCSSILKQRLDGTVNIRSLQGPGSSGSPLANELGQWVGLINASAEDDRTLALVTPVTDATRDLIASTWQD